MEQFPEQRSKSLDGSGIEEIGGGQTQGQKILPGQIAPADPQIPGQIAEHVRHLEALTEALASRPHGGRVPPAQGGAVRHGHVRPEFADAAGGVVGVPVQVRPGLEGGKVLLVFPREGAQVLLHALGECQQEAPNAEAILLRQAAKDAEALREAEQQVPLGRSRLRPGQRLGDLEQAGGGREIQLLAEQVQVVEAIGSGDDAGIRDGIRRSRQEVGQPHRSPQRRRQDGQGQVE